MTFPPSLLLFLRNCIVWQVWLPLVHGLPIFSIKAESIELETKVTDDVLWPFLWLPMEHFSSAAWHITARPHPQALNLHSFYFARSVI